MKLSSIFDSSIVQKSFFSEKIFSSKFTKITTIVLVIIGALVALYAFYRHYQRRGAINAGLPAALKPLQIENPDEAESFAVLAPKRPVFNIKKGDSFFRKGLGVNMRIWEKEFHENSFDYKPMLDGVKTYTDIACKDPLPEGRPRYNTLFRVVERDTTTALIDLSNDPNDKSIPAGPNFMNSEDVGGHSIGGAAAQEEALCATTDEFLALASLALNSKDLQQILPRLEKEFNENGHIAYTDELRDLLQGLGVIYTPHIRILRDMTGKRLENNIEVAFVAVAAPDLRGSRDREKFEISNFWPLTEKSLRASPKYKEYREELFGKIYNMIKTMALNGHTKISLGALGCGVFSNPPGIIAEVYAEVLALPEFTGVFNIVEFSILNRGSPIDQANVDAFKPICRPLNELNKANVPVEIEVAQ